MVAERLIGEASINTLSAILSTSRSLGWQFETSSSGKRINRAFVKLTRSAGVVDTETFNFGTPGVLDQSDGGIYYTLGLEFTPSADGYVKGIDWRCPTNGPAGVQQGGLWTKADKGLVASSETLTATPATINRILFTSVYRVTAGVTYVVGVLTNRYAYTAGTGGTTFPGFTTDNMNAPTGVNGRFDETTAGLMIYPDNIHPNGANYHVSPVYDRESVFVAGTKWQLWKRESPISSSTLLQSIEIGSGVIAGVGFTWKEVPGITQSSIIAGESYFTNIFHPSSDPGDYLFASAFGNPSGVSLSGNCIFKNGGTNTQPPDDETFTDGAFAVDVEIDESTAQFAVIGQVVETGSVFAISPRKIVDLNQITETGTAFPVSVLRSQIIGQVTESGIVYPVTVVKSREIGQVAETGTVYPISGLKSAEIGQVTEEGTAFAVASSQIVSAEIGQVIEFGSPGRLGPTPDVDTSIAWEIGTTLVEF